MLRRFGIKPAENFAPINALQEDKQRPGTFLALQGFALVELRPDTERSILAGSPQNFGSEDGNSSEARFGSMYSFLQVDNASYILVADADNACIRKVERDSWDVRTHSGICEATDSNKKVSIDGGLENARYVYPFEICSSPWRPERLYITDKKRIKVIKAEQGTVHTLFEAERWWSTGYFKRIDFSPSLNVFVTTHEDGIYMFNSTFDLEKQIQPNYNVRDPVTNRFFERTKQGDIFSLDALLGTFSNFEDVIALSDGAVLATLGGLHMTRSLVVIDVPSENMTLACVSTLVGEPRLPEDLRHVCQYQTDGRDLQLINSTLYISGSPSTQDQYSTGVETIQLNSK